MSNSSAFFFSLKPSAAHANTLFQMTIYSFYVFDRHCAAGMPFPIGHLIVNGQSEEANKKTRIPLLKYTTKIGIDHL
jgi:hypothetical protein